MNNLQKPKSAGHTVKWALVLYDLCILSIVGGVLLGLYPGVEQLSARSIFMQFLFAVISIFGLRFAANIYGQIWRYGGVESYIRLLCADGAAFVLFYLFQLLLPKGRITVVRLLAFCSINLLGALFIRMVYRAAYKHAGEQTPLGKLLRQLLIVFSGNDKITELNHSARKIKIAIIGAGRVGTNLAEELIYNKNSSYVPRCFIDISKEKIGRQIFGIPVFPENEATFSVLNDFGVQEVVFALPQLSTEELKALYERYLESGCKLKVYDFSPTLQSVGSGKRHMREFDVEELLFRKPLEVADERTSAYYQGKTVLITGGGGSIGSELCRQIAKMRPRRLVILDIYENGAYDVQQELRGIYGNALDLRVEIVSVCNRTGLARVFAEHRPQVVIHAAAHKHVPFMEQNCVEAVENNVFGTLCTVELSEEYGAERFLMVSTDKAVNPTNVMGATKRMCEMIVQAHSSLGGKTVFSATRFGNVLGSAGSVIPLFKRQIMNGGPITLTDARIIRYFMTIPEASQLVLKSGALAKNGELFVLDMGSPVKIYDLAVNMIRLSGMVPGKDIKIVETGLRPGEKLYEELLVKTEELDKTEDKLIFVERDVPPTPEELTEKLSILRAAVTTGDDNAMKAALKQVVETYRDPEEVNRAAEKAEEMQLVKA